MAVYRNRSTNSAPDALSTSYLIGSPPIGTSTMTFTSSGGLMPVLIASMFMVGSVLLPADHPPEQAGGHPSRQGTPRRLLGDSEGRHCEAIFSCVGYHAECRPDGDTQLGTA